MTIAHHRHPPCSTRVHTPSPSPLSSLSLSPLLSLSAVCLTQAQSADARLCVGCSEGALCDPMGRGAVPGRCPVWSLSLIPPVMLGVRLWRLRSQGGELIPLNNQLSGAVGGRASSALISIVKASLRAVFRGGSFVDGCGTAAQPVPRRGLRLFAAGGLLLAAMAKNSSRHTPRAYALARREAHAPRRGGRMRNDAARDAFRGPEIKLL